ncbi:MAG: MFS transporter [Caldisericaceae bacterium]
MEKTAMIENIKRKFDLYFPSFRYRNFKLFFFGQLVSVIGTWMQNIGQGWLVLQITNSPFKLGLLTAVQFLPALFLSLYAGAIIDKMSKRKIIIFTQVSFTVLAFILGLLVALRVVQYWQVLIIAFFTGLINTIDMPARQAFYTDLVDKEYLMNSISLNSSTFNLARILGPAISGILISVIGYAWCFFINAISFIPVIVALFLIRERTIRKGSFNFRDIRGVNKSVISGIDYVKGIPIILITFAVFAVVNVFGLNFNVLIPVLVQNVLKLSSQQYGFVMSMMGVGALTASLLLAIASYKGLKHLYFFGSSVLLGVTLILLGLQRSYTLTLVLVAFSGFFMVTFLNVVNTLLQMESSIEFRGRVMSFYSLVLLGFTPFGSLFTGAMSERFGVNITHITVGIIVFTLTILIYFSTYRKAFGHKELNVTRIIGAENVPQLKK